MRDGGLLERDVPGDGARLNSDEFDRSEGVRPATRTARRVVLFATYAGLHWLAHLWRNLRRFLMAVVLFTLLLATAVFLPAVNFRGTAAYRYATYTHRVNGPLTSNALVDAAKVAGGDIAALTSLGTLMSSGDRSSSTDIYVIQDPARQDLTWFAGELRTSGRALKATSRDELVIGSTIARRLHLSPGDTVTIEVPSPDGMVNAKARVVGVYAASGPTGSGALLSPGTAATRLLEGLGASSTEDPVVFSDFLVRIPDDTAASVTALEEVFAEDPNISLEGREERLATAQRSADDLLGASTQYVLPGASLLAVLLIVIREQHGRLLRRRQELGLLAALGAPVATVGVLIIAETVGEALLAGLIAVPVARELLEDRLYLFLPTRLWLQMWLVLVATTAMVAFGGWIHARLAVRRHTISQLLAEEV